MNDMKTASPLFALVLAAASVGTASAASLEGRVVNGTTGQAGRADRIELIDVATSMTPLAVVENVDGDFQFADVPTSVAHLLLRVSYGGVVSSQSLSSLEEPVEVKVFESTRSLEAVVLGRHHVLFQRDGEHMLATELLEYDNRTDPPTAIAAEALPMRLWMGNAMHGDPTASVGSGQMPVSMPLIAAADDAQVMGVQQALPPGTTRVIVRYNFEYHEGQNTWQGRALYPTEDRRLLVAPLDVRVVADQMISTESPLEGFASWTGLPVEPGAQWSVSLAGGSSMPNDGHNHPVAGADQAVTQVQVRSHRFSENNTSLWLALGLGAALVLVMLVGLARAPAQKLSEDKHQAAESDKRRRISRVADRYVSGEITREQFEHDRDAILGGKRVGHHQNGATHRVETTSH